MASRVASIIPRIPYLRTGVLNGRGAELVAQRSDCVIIPELCSGAEVFKFEIHRCLRSGVKRRKYGNKDKNYEKQITPQGRHCQNNILFVLHKSAVQIHFSPLLCNAYMYTQTIELLPYYMNSPVGEMLFPIMTYLSNK